MSVIRDRRLHAAAISRNDSTVCAMLTCMHVVSIYCQSQNLAAISVNLNIIHNKS